MNIQLVHEYLAAFATANPGAVPPKVTYNRGWYRIGENSNPMRESKLIECRDRLRSRSEAKQEQLVAVMRTHLDIGQ